MLDPLFASLPTLPRNTNREVPAPIAPKTPVVIPTEIKRGDVIQLGAHRIMCGDAGSPEDVATLFGDVKPDLVFTSPPYAQQRTYVNGIGDWDVLMQRVFGAMPWHDKTQVLVNLGLVHNKGEWQPYWDGWIEWMRGEGWRRFGWYVWDKLDAMPGDWAGRLAPSFEFIWHFNKDRRKPNKTIPCKWAGTVKTRPNSGGLRKADGSTTSWNHDGKECQSFKIPDSTIRITPEKGGVRRDHPAVFPVALPLAIHAAYTDPGDVVYDPFGGSGTSIIAAEQGKRICYAMEIEPSYVQIAVDRYNKSLK